MVNLNSTASFLENQMVQRRPCASSSPNPRTWLEINVASSSYVRLRGQQKIELIILPILLPAPLTSFLSVYIFPFISLCLPATRAISFLLLKMFSFIMSLY